MWIIAALICWGVSAAPVREIQFKGLARFSHDTVANYTQVQIGDDLNSPDLPVLIKKLYATDFFDDIKANFDDGILVIEVEEKPMIKSFDIPEKIGQIAQDDLSRLLEENRLVPGATFSQHALETFLQTIRQILTEQGYFSARLTATTDLVGPASMEIRLVVDQGALARVASINFYGNNHVNSDTLLGETEHGISSWFSYITHSDHFKRAKLEQDVQKILCFYRERGFAFVQVTDYRASLSEDGQNVSLDFVIEEGPLCEIQDVTVTGVASAEVAQWAQKLPCRYRQSLINQWEKSLRTDLVKNGYNYSQILTDLRPKQEEKIRVVFQVITGGKVSIGRYNIIGNSKTQERIIRNHLIAPEGSAYNPEDLAKIREALERTKMFEEVEVLPVRLPNNQVDINIRIKEARTMTGSLHGGINTLGLEGGISAGDRNFGGTGTDWLLSLSNRQQSRELRFHAANAYLSRYNYNLGYSFEYTRANPNENNLGLFDLYSFAAPRNKTNVTQHVLSTGWRASYRSSVNLSTAYVREKILPLQPTDNSVTDKFLFVGLGVNRNLFNHAFLATHGYRLQASANCSTPLSDYQFADANLVFQYVQPLPGDFAFYQQYKFQSLFPYGSGAKRFIPEPRLFNCGGAEEIRGYHPYAVGPSLNNRVIPGNIKAVVRSELLVPFRFFNRNINLVKFSLFLDAGQMWRTVQIPEGTYSAAHGFKFSTGICVRVGALYPLTLSLNFPLDAADRDSPKREIFSFTQSLEF